MFERPDTGDKTLLVHVGTDTFEQTIEESDEFRELAKSAGLTLCDEVIARRGKPDPRTFVGSGKLEEIRLRVKEQGVELVLFSRSLSPSQERNLEKTLEVRVLDRNSLILDIFAQRARTFEGKLQVELAQLVHLSTRLVRGWTHLERQKGGIGLRGPGETQLETDRRLLSMRVRTIRQRLDKVRRQREQGRVSRQRSGIATVSLVGYTNAGKSTLFNQLTSEDVYTADQLFATLDPTLRELALAGGRQVVLADTVGFISRLPHELVDAFRSTLTETREATLLLHVVDVSDDERQVRMDDVDLVLNEIGANQVPQLIVNNKIDRTGQPTRLERDASGRPTAVWLSAVTGAGIDLLKQALIELTGQQRVQGWLTLLPSDGRVRAQLYQRQGVLEELVNADGTMNLRIDIDRRIWELWCRESHLDCRFTPAVPVLAASGYGQ